jgi:hypothetical protein
VLGNEGSILTIEIDTVMVLKTCLKAWKGIGIGGLRPPDGLNGPDACAEE